MKKNITDLQQIFGINNTSFLRSRNKINALKKAFVKISVLSSCACYSIVAPINVKTEKEFLSNTNSRYLLLTGSVKQITKNSNFESPVDSAKVCVLNESNNTTRIIYSNSDGLFNIRVGLNQQLVIQLTKKGLVSKTIQVDTRVKKERNTYLFQFEVIMFEDIKEIDASILKKPIAEITFNESLKCFDYSSVYSKEVNERLRRAYSKYYRSQYLRVKAIAESDEKTEYHLDKAEKISDTSSTKKEIKNKSPQNPTQKTSLNNQRPGVYQIQIMTLSGHLPSCAKAFRGCGRVSEYIINKKYIYAVGEYSSAEAAGKDVARVREKFKDAFPVAVINGTVIPIIEAPASLGKN